MSLWFQAINGHPPGPPNTRNKHRFSTFLPASSRANPSTRDGNYPWLNQDTPMMHKLVLPSFTKTEALKAPPERPFAKDAQTNHHLINCSCVLPERRAARWCEGCEWSLWSCCGKDNTNVYGVAATPETDRIRHRRRDPLTRVWLRGPGVHGE